jgi:hypothetical protein
MFGFKKSKDTYSYKMVMHFSSDPRTTVHDIHGDFTLEEGETTDDACGKIIAEYREIAGIPHRAGVHVLSWDYR